MVGFAGGSETPPLISNFRTPRGPSTENEDQGTASPIANQGIAPLREIGEGYDIKSYRTNLYTSFKN